MCINKITAAVHHIIFSFSFKSYQSSSFNANSADDKLMSFCCFFFVFFFFFVLFFFFLFFSENRLQLFMQIVSSGDKIASLEDNLHEMSKPIFWKE